MKNEQKNTLKDMGMVWEAYHIGGPMIWESLESPLMLGKEVGNYRFPKGFLGIITHKYQLYRAIL